MIGKIFLTAFLAVFTQAQYADVTPLPGSIAASLNVTSLNNILALAAPLAANEVLNGKTFEINYKKRGIAGIYSIDIKDITFITVDGFDVKDISFREGTDTLVATVGGIKPGCFRIGNTGGMMDNIIRSKLYRPGSVAYVSRSGGMSNELNNILSLHTDGVYEGVAIGGDRYPVSTFVDHLLRYQEDPKVKMMVLLGEIGGVEEYIVCDLLKQKRITKPIIAWCIGTCSDVFSTDVQFGHAGASASGAKETARAKNLALKQAGAVVPESFDDLGVAIEGVFKRLLQSGEILPLKEVAPPPVPMDYSWAREVGLIRRPAAFVTSMSDERGDELMYAGVKVSEVVESGKGMGGVMALLWFQKDLPQYFCKFMELCLMVTADHGPAVSGAHNTIVSSRAGKDLVSSLCS